MNDKLFDCVIICADDKDRKKVRFANDLANRTKVFARANWPAPTFAKSFDEKLSKIDILQRLTADDSVYDDLSEVDYNLVED
jgi:hypothetical protein